MKPPRHLRTASSTARRRMLAAALLLALALPITGCSARRAPDVKIDRRPVVDHPGAPLPPGLNPGDVQVHDMDTMLRARTPFANIIEQLPPPVFAPDASAPPPADTSTTPIEPSLKVQRAYVAAQHRLREGRIFEATRRLTEADRLMPDQPEILRLLGHIYISTGNKVRGRDYLIRALKIDPSDLLGMYELGRQALRDNDEDEAIATLAYLVRSVGDEMPAYLPLAHHHLAVAMQRRGYDVAAIEQFHQYMERSESVRPRQAQVALQLRLLAREQGNTLMQMGDLYARLGRPGDALLAYQQAQAAKASRAQALLRRLVYINLRLNRNDDAVQVMVDHVHAIEATTFNLRDQELLTFLARVYPSSSAPLASELRAFYEKNDRGSDLAIAVAAMLDDARADAFLREHLQAKPHDERVFKAMLRRRLGDDPAAVDAARIAAAVQITSEILHWDDELLALYITHLFTLVDNSRKLADSFATFPPALQQDRYARLIQGECLYRLQRNAEAVVLLENLVRDEPDLVTPRRSLAALLIEQGQPADALKIIQPVATAKNPAAIQLQAAALLRLDRSDEAQQVIDKALSAAPGDPDLIVAKAEVQANRNDTLGAERTLMAGITSNNQQEKFYLGLLDLYLGPMSSRVDIGKKFRNLAGIMHNNMPRNRHARVLRARVYEADGEYPSAVSLLRAVLRADPEDLPTMRQLGALYKNWGRPLEARRLITDRLKDLPDNPDQHYELATVASVIDEPDLSESIMVDVLKRHPNHVSTNNDLGYTWIDKGIHLDQAVKMIEIAIRADPENAHYIDSLGWGYYKLGRFDEAVVQLEKAAKIDADPIVLDHLGDAQYRAGQKDAAIATWTKAREILIAEDLSSEPYASLRGTVLKKIDAVRLKREPNTAPLGMKINTPDDQAANPGT